LRNTTVAIQRNSNHYWHFVTEVLPSLIAWERHLHNTDSIAITGSDFAVPLLRLAGFNRRLLTVRQPSAIRVMNVNLLKLLPSGYLNPTLLFELSSRIVSAAKSDRSRPEVVFLSRTRNDSRALLNVGEVVEIIRRRFRKLEIVCPGGLSVEDQVCSLLNARIVIAPHGSQATNMLWSRSLEHYIEIVPDGNDDQSYATLASVMGGQVHYCPSKSVNPQDHYSNHDCDLEKLRGILSRL